ncbi:MAG: hypothetical protein J0I84_11990, partial [Terrimonas sp.]|nr:hypothetical protein [Terrimonas sp.]
ARARHSMPLEYVYISDVALERFENDDSYKVYPQTGIIQYRNQWGVSHCMREGKNAIKLELKKLYEGVPYEFISHLNKFSIEKSSVVPGENIVMKAERIVRRYIRFGENLTQIVNRICGFGFNITDIITLNKEEIEYTGWQNFPEFDLIAHHINLKTFSKEQFISRCKELNNLINENLCERPLRKVVNALGFSEEDTGLKRGVKLLEMIIKYLHVVKETGLNTLKHKEIILERVTELKNFTPVLQLVKLNDLRQLDAHKNSGDKQKFSSALKAFSINSASLSNNYADACYKVYDGLDEMFLSLNDLLEVDFL